MSKVATSIETSPLKGGGGGTSGNTKPRLITRREKRDREERRRIAAAKAAKQKAADLGESLWKCIGVQNIIVGLLGAWTFALFVLACYDIDSQPKFDLKVWVIVDFCMGAVYFVWFAYSLHKHCTVSRQAMENDEDEMPWTMKWSPIYILAIAILFLYAGSHGASLLKDRDSLMAADPVKYLVDINLILMATATACGMYVIMCIAAMFGEMLSWKHVAQAGDDELIEDVEEGIE